MLNESLVEGAYAWQSLAAATPAAAAPAEGVLADGALASCALVDGALANDANGRRYRARPGVSR